MISLFTYEIFFEPMYLIVRRFFFCFHVSSSVRCLLYIDVVRLKNETTAQCDCAKEYKCHDVVTHKTDIHEIT